MAVMMMDKTTDLMVISGKPIASFTKGTSRVLFIAKILMFYENVELYHRVL